MLLQDQAQSEAEHAMVVDRQDVHGVYLEKYRRVRRKTESLCIWVKLDAARTRCAPGQQRNCAHIFTKELMKLAGNFHESR